MVGLVVLGIAVGFIWVYMFQPKYLYLASLRLTRWWAGIQRKQCQVGRLTWTYSERGQATPDVATLLLVHGFSAASDSWNLMLKDLPKYLHVVAVDLPGHGDTPDDPEESMSKAYAYYVRNLRLFVESIGLGQHPLHIAGLSMGGGIAGCYSADYPEYVRMTSLICPGMKTPVLAKLGRDEMEQKKELLVPETAEDLVTLLNKYAIYTPMMLPLQLMKGMMDARKKYEPFLKKLKKALIQSEYEGNLNSKMDKIKAPVHILWGEEDYIVDVSGAQLLKDNISNVQQYDIIPLCGHAVDLEKGKLLAQKLLLFWTKYSGRS